MLDEVEVPVLGVMEVGETAVDQRADEVEGERRSLVALDQPMGLGNARRLSEARAEVRPNK